MMWSDRAYVGRDRACGEMEHDAGRDSVMQRQTEHEVGMAHDVERRNMRETEHYTGRWSMMQGETA